MTTTILEAKIAPGASCTEVAEWNEGVVRIRVAAAPEKGKANKELIRFLAKSLGLRKADLSIATGKTSRRKTVAVTGLSADEIRQRLKP